MLEQEPGGPPDEDHDVIPSCPVSLNQTEERDIINSHRSIARVWGKLSSNNPEEDVSRINIGRIFETNAMIGKIVLA